MVPSLKITALILLEIFLIECCTVLVEPPMTSSLKIQKGEYLRDEKRYSKKENAILLYSEKPFTSATIIFYFIGTLLLDERSERNSQIKSRLILLRPSVPLDTKWTGNRVTVNSFEKLSKRLCVSYDCPHVTTICVKLRLENVFK